jgi:hypothetical protein
MKAAAFCLFLLMSFVHLTPLHAQRFILGADRLHLPDPGSLDSMKLVEWDHVKSFGLNAGAYYEGWPHQMTKDALDLAVNHDVDSVVILPQVWDKAFGQRWKYHPEYDKHYVDTGMTGEQYLHQGNGDNHSATTYPLMTGSPRVNCKRALVGTHDTDTLCDHLCFPFSRELRGYKDRNWDPPVFPLRIHVRVRLRLVATENSTLDVIRVTVQDSGRTPMLLSDYTITTDDGTRTPSTGTNAPRLGNTNSYGEVYAGSFVYADSTTLANTMINIKVYWPGNVSVYLDYIALDDSLANDLFGGRWNGMIDSTVSCTLGSATGRMLHAR